MSQGEFLGEGSTVGDVLRDIFGGDIFGTPHLFRADGPKKHKSDIKYDYPDLIDPDVVRQILAMYADGVAITDIEAYFGMDVNKIIDRYSPFL